MTKMFQKLGPPREELISKLFEFVTMILPKEPTLHRVVKESVTELYDLAFRRGMLVSQAEMREIADAIDEFALKQTKMSGVSRRKLAMLTNKLRKSW